jgi:hypothetical protein
MKKLYLANIVTEKTPQQEQKNIEWFSRTKKLLESLGIECWDPMAAEHETPNQTWEQYIVQDLKDMRDHCDRILMGKRWKESLGARVERAEAIRLGFPVYYE